ncbi:MAG: hypothetical protein IJY87_04550 [Bacilli bacterium]|nr:hypothetical protein [Bacilli bacterium]
MKEKRVKELKNELNVLLKEEVEKELILNDSKLEDEKISVKDIAKEIYLKRGIDVSKLNKGLINNLIDNISELFNLFKNKDKKTKNKMYLEIVYIVLLLILMKIPFDLVRDIGYEYIELITTNSLFYTLWNFAFLLLYTITLICSVIVLTRNFNKKYKDTSL